MRFVNIAEHILAPQECLKYVRVEMVGPGTRIAVCEDVDCGGVIKRLLIGAFASTGVIYVAHRHDSRRQWNSLTGHSGRIPSAVPSLMMVKRDIESHFKIRRRMTGQD